MAELLVGKVTHYYAKIGVAALGLEGHLRAGDKVHIVGHTTDLVQTVASLEIEHGKVDAAGPGDDVAIKVDDKVRDGDEVFLTSEIE
jgi:putative protease